MSDFLRKFCPDEFVESVLDIDVKRLKDNGIKALLIDLDNTLVPWQGYQTSDETKTWIKNAINDGMKICLVSNTRTKGRLSKLAEQLNVEYSVQALKPRRAGFIEALNQLGVNPSEAVVIGDQVFTDVYGGNRLGIYTILVHPMNKKEFFGTKISRLFEKSMMNSFRKRGWIKNNHKK